MPEVTEPKPTSETICEALMDIMDAMNRKQNLSDAEHELTQAMTRYFIRTRSVDGQNH